MLNLSTPLNDFRIELVEEFDMVFSKTCYCVYHFFLRGIHCCIRIQEEATQ